MGKNEARTKKNMTTMLFLLKVVVVKLVVSSILLVSSIAAASNTPDEPVAPGATATDLTSFSKRELQRSGVSSDGIGRALSKPLSLSSYGSYYDQQGSNVSIIIYRYRIYMSHVMSAAMMQMLITIHINSYHYFFIFILYIQPIISDPPYNIT
jgi:hypothetical protein